MRGRREVKNAQQWSARAGEYGLELRGTRAPERAAIRDGWKKEGEDESTNCANGGRGARHTLKDSKYEGR